MGDSEGLPPESASCTRSSLPRITRSNMKSLNRQFRTFLGESRYRGQPAGKWLTDDKARAEPETLPVVHVSYHDASVMPSGPANPSHCLGAPEMAARSADSRRFPWGNDPVKWARARKPRQIDPVMSFPEEASPYGAFLTWLATCKNGRKTGTTRSTHSTPANRMAENPMTLPTCPQLERTTAVGYGARKSREFVPRRRSV